MPNLLISTLQPPTHEATMTTIGAYRLGPKLGQGGIGVVYAATHPDRPEPAAVKQLRPELQSNPALVAQFRHAAQLNARLHHPHIVTPIEIGEQDGVPYQVLPVLHGGTVRQQLHQEPRPVARLWQLLGQAAEALDAAHAQGAVHGDVKPTNLLFDTAGRCYVADFNVDQQSSERMVMPGTPRYMSPEQWRGEPLDGRSDQYNLAVLVYEALAGHPPFNGDQDALQTAHLTLPPPPLVGLEVGLGQALTPILDRAMAKKPADRYGSVSALVMALVTASLPFMSDQPMLPRAAAAEPETPPENHITPSTAIDADQQEQLAQAYSAGLEAMNRSDWPAAVEQFDQIVQVDRYYRSALTLRREAERQLQTPLVIVRPNPAPSPQSVQPTQPKLEAVPPAAPLSGPPQTIIAGAGGSTGRPSIRRRLWPTLLLLLCLGLGAASAAGLAWSQGYLTPGTPVVANSPTPTVVMITLSLTVNTAGDGATWEMDDVRQPLRSSEQLVIPDGRKVHFYSGAAALQLRLPNGSTLSLGPDTTLDLRFGGNSPLEITLLEGSVVTGSILGGSMGVKNQFGAAATNQNGLMGVSNSQNPFRFDVHCLSGTCQVQGDLGGEANLAAGEATYVGGSGRPGELEPARFETYALLDPNIPTRTPSPTTTPAPEDTATPTPSATAAPTRTAVPTRLPSHTPTPTPTATETTIINIHPVPSIIGFPCTNPSVYRLNQSIPFEWNWNGTLKPGEYLEIRIGPRGSTNLNSIGAAPPPASGNKWVWNVPVTNFFVGTAYDYHWEVVYMAANQRTVLSRSTRGCIKMEIN